MRRCCISPRPARWARTNGSSPENGDWRTTSAATSVPPGRLPDRLEPARRRRSGPSTGALASDRRRRAGSPGDAGGPWWHAGTRRLGGPGPSSWPWDGDLQGARDIASARMSPGMAGLFDRFFSRLPTLNPAERARAVHFGDMPADGARYASVRPVGDRLALATNTQPPPRSVVQAGGRAAGGALIRVVPRLSPGLECSGRLPRIAAPRSAGPSDSRGSASWPLLSRGRKHPRRCPLPFH